MSRTRIRIPLAFGNLTGLLGTCIAFLLVYYAASIQYSSIKFILYLLSIGCLIFFPHCLAHFIVGSSVKIRFKYYGVGRSSISKLALPIRLPSLPVLTLIIDHRSFVSVSWIGRAAMYASGVIASVTMPFIVVVYTFNQLSISLWLILLVLVIANLLFDLYYSPKFGDLSRIRRPATSKRFE
jgi:hypothetical protein